MKKVEIGSEVLIRFDDGIKEEYKIVHPQEADILESKVSSNSPFGKGVLGQNERAKIIFKTPSGEKVSCEILKIERGKETQ